MEDTMQEVYEKVAMEIFQKLGVFLEGHFLYTSGRHGEKYINKDRLYPGKVPRILDT